MGENPPSDRGARPQDEGALARLVDRYQQPLLSRIRRMMGPEARQSAESSDILQSVFTDTIRDLQDDLVRDEKRLLLRMTAAARHRIIDEVRRRREQSIEQVSGVARTRAESSVASQLCAKEALQRLGDALDTLDPVRRSVVELRSFDGWSWQSISDALGRSEEAVRKLYHRALLELGQRLAALDSGSMFHVAAPSPG